MIMLYIRIPNWLDAVFAWPVLLYRKLKFGCIYRKIYLDEGKWTILDPKDYYRYAGFKWCIGGNNGNLYAVRGQMINSANSKIVLLHRLIMNAPDGLLVDHRFGDSLDNRRAFLRLATHSQNQFNKRKSKNKSSKFKGVSFHKALGKWNAYIAVGGVKIHLGYFKSEIEAARAFDLAARKYRGEFASFNLPENVPAC